LTHPIFAIVGHPNKGKSSIVATLAEDESVAISPDPGTTRKSRGYQMRIDEQVLYELVDTPGFQRPRAVLSWLQEHERGADERAAVVEEFVATHRGDERFRDECELLQPIIDGAGILYVVDGAHPYGTEYEAEMEILRWTGRPRMALINMIGPGDFVEDWRRALNQYFSIVRVFDAQRADFSKRLELLRAFRELGEVGAQWSRALDQAVAALERDRADRRRRAAAEIADLLIDVLSMHESAPAPEGVDQKRLTAELIAKLKARVRRREQSARRLVQDLYGHRALDASEEEVSVLAEDLFSKRSFLVFGLSARQLALTGAAAGAVTGGMIDLAVGGASLLLGAGIGAAIGGVGAVLGADRLARVQVLGTPLGGFRLTVGPITTPNAPWVILGRAVLHHRLVAERNHARRDALILDASAGAHLGDAIDPAVRKRMAVSFKRIREDGGLAPDRREALIDDVQSCLSSS
jgi:hypothetical protein